MWYSRRQESVFNGEGKNEIVAGKERGAKIGEITVCLYVAWEQFSTAERRIDDVGKN